MLAATSSSRVRGFDRGAWLVLLFAVGLIAGSLGQLAYRFTLPTDGWRVLSGPTDEWVYWRNVVGAPSPLQENDTLLAIAGLPASGAPVTNRPWTAPPGWTPGGQVEMTVLRQGREITFTVPVVRWTPRIWLREVFTSLDQVVALLTSLFMVAVGFFTFARRPDVPSARALLVLCAAAGAGSISGSLPDGLSVQFDPVAFMLVAFFSYLIFGVLLAPALLTFTLYFPRPKQIISRRAWVGFIPHGVGVALLLLAAIDLNLGLIGWILTPVMMLASIASLVHSALTQRDAVSRAQLRWALGGFGAGLGIMLLTFPSAFGWVKDEILAMVLSSSISLGFVVIGVSLSVAILRYRLYDIDVIIRKTLVYAAVTALLGLVYAGSVILLQRLFETASGQQSPLAIVLSTLFAAALFAPLRRRVQDGVDRRFFRRKVDAAAALAAFAEAVRDETDLDDLTGRLAGVVQETMQPDRVSVWLKELPS